MGELVTRPYARCFVEWAAHKPDVLCLSADLTGSCEVDDFRDQYPERFISFGMAEQNMMGVAAGLARTGFIPFVHSFSVFVTRRPYDQVGMSIAYPNLPVRLIAFLPGLTTPGGVTHQAIDDVALMRAIPNMTVLDCGDATEVETVLELTEEIDGPVFCRMLRGQVPRLFADPMRLGQARVLSTGQDVCVISSGICTEEAMRAVHLATEQGVGVTHLHVSTLKPFRDPSILAAIESTHHGVISMENHSVIGGLGSAVAELMAEEGLSRPLVRMGLRDTYAHGGSRPYLLNYYGLTARHLIESISTFVGKRLTVGAEAWLDEQVGPPKTEAKAEAL